MKVIRASLFIAVFSGFATLSSCENLFSDCEGDYSFSGDNLFSFHIEDKNTRENILYVMNMKYNYDSVTIYDKDWNVALAAPIGLGGSLHLRFIDRDEDKDVINQLITKRFYMYFNYQDIDTIDIEFRMVKNDCDHQVMQYFKASYNDIAYVDELAEQVPGASFLK